MGVSSDSGREQVHQPALVEGSMSQWSQKTLLKNPETESKEMQTQWDSLGYKHAAPMQWFPAGTTVEK